jgi:hypothetical protein
VARQGSDLLVGIPSEWAAVAGDKSRATKVRATVSAAFERAIADGYVAVSCERVGADSACYRLRPATLGADEASGSDGGVRK